MKIRFLITSLLIACTLMANAQKKKKDQPAQQQAAPAEAVKEEPKKEEPVAQPALNLTQHFARKYATAVQWNDYDVAKDALYDLIVENPANDSLISDLAFFYFQNQKYAPAVLVAQELLNRNPKNMEALEISASGLESLGALDRSLQNYESLYLLSNNLAALYKMAFLQYQLKRLKESATSADILLASKEIDTIKISFTDAQNQSKEYSMKVAVVNLKGMITRDQGDKVGAKKLFEQALALAPDFAAAKQNLAELK